MNFKDYKAGTYRKEYQYECFVPSTIDHPWAWDDPNIHVMLEKANFCLGELNAFSHIVPDIDLFIQMHVAKEAQKSSRIEGTKTEFDEVLMDVKDISPEKRDDWQEVQNYIKAINYAVKELENLPLSNRLLRDTHSILLEGVRGEFKSPGEFRKSQNWIGGSNLMDAVFIPPNHDLVPELMSDLEKFMHNNDVPVPHLIKVAISHYQFETIHPFLDGNGRIGRLLITLYLVSNRLLFKPSLYLSDFFEKHKILYYDALSHVRITNELSHWVKFFLNAIIETSEKGKNTFKAILELKDRIDQKIVTLNRKATKGRSIISYLYRKPITTSNEIVEYLKVTPKTANEIINDLLKIGILKEITGYKRNRNYAFEEYIKLFLL